MAPDKEFIQIENLTYTYPGAEHPALEGISVTIPAGEMVFICGDSGCGKSTLGKAVTGAVPHFYGGSFAGRILLAGRDVAVMSHEERASAITMVFQDPERQLLMNTVHREIAFGPENLGMPSSEIRRRVWESMQFCNILDLREREIATLSGGQKQKVAIAAAIACRPRCILFDEPTSQLDPLSAEEILGLIGKINRELGITVLVIEQRVERCFELSSRILHLDRGRASFYGSRERFYQEGEERFLPVHLRLSRHAGIPEMPSSFKEAGRQLLASVPSGSSAIQLNGTPPASSLPPAGKEQIVLRRLRTGYGSRKVLKDLDLAVGEGEFLGIIGPNGSGKSTLLKALAGLLPYGGSLKICGEEASGFNRTLLGRTLGYISQNPNDYLSKDSVHDELRFTLDNFGIPDDGRIDETLEELGLSALRNRNPRDLSGGERQRAAIASVLVNHPRILLLDEPTRGLDSTLKHKLGELLTRLNRQGMTILLVTHDIEFAAECCSRFLLLFDGEAVSSGGREDVLRDGIFYTTASSKLLREIAPDIVTLDQAKGWWDSHE